MRHFLSIVLPVYNQADHIGHVVRGHLAALNDMPAPFELLLVVNGCRDNSLDVCNELAAQSPLVKVVFSEPGGWGLAVRLGLKSAQGDLLCYTNSARTSSEALRNILDIALDSPTKVIKARRTDRGGIARRFGSWLFNTECGILFGVKSKDVNGTPKCFPRDMYPLHELLEENGDLIDAEFLAHCRRLKAEVIEAPITASARHGGKSTTSLKTARGLLLGAPKLWRRMRGNRS